MERKDSASLDRYDAETWCCDSALLFLGVVRATATANHEASATTACCVLLGSVLLGIIMRQDYKP
jgi:hypothetical protein